VRGGGVLLFDQRSYRLFEEIIKHELITKQELMRQLNLTDRQLMYDLEKLNHALSCNKLPKFDIHHPTIHVDDQLKNLSKENLLLEMHTNPFTVSEHDRVYLIYLYTFIRKEPVSNYHFQLLLGVSKNTALTDVKRLKDMCKQWNSEFNYTRMDGYHIVGNEMDKRRMAIFSVNYLLTQPLGKEIIVLALKSWGNTEILIKTQQIINTFLKDKGLNLVKSRKAEMIIHLAFINVRNQHMDLLLTEFEKQLLERQSMFNYGKVLAEELFSEGGGNESYYVTIQLLTALQVVTSRDNRPLEVLAGQIVDEFERNTLLPIKQKEFLKRSLFDHLVPAFFRITFGIPLVNTLTETIKAEYTELFQFVERSLAPLTLWTGKEISEAEIGYFTMHFGGFLENTKKLKSDKITALIVCSNGLSSSIMLEAQLKDMFPEVVFSRVNSGDKLEDISTSTYDLVFSTVQVVSVKPVFIVKPLLSLVEKNYLNQSVIKQFPSLSERNFSVDQLMEVIKKHTEIKNENKLFSDLVNLFYSHNQSKGMHKPMLSELLTQETICFTDEILDWKKAIMEASQPLIQSNKVDKRYVNAMITNVEEVGTYIHIGKGIAIPHARPEDGVNQLGMSFLRTRKPVLLLDQDDHKIDIFICLAAVDSEAHLKALAQLTKILGDKDLLESIKSAETAEQVIEIIKKGEE
jgi:ascorbate PTS system EIIA or EIIAB component